LHPALYVGGALVALASAAALALPRRRPEPGSYEAALAA
jgi:hypothetical protein